MDYSRRLLSRFRPRFRHRHDLFVCRSLKRREHDHRNGLALRPAVLRVKTIALAETLLAEPDQHRDIALHRELGLLPANAQVERGVPTFEHFAQLGVAEMTLNSGLRYLEPCGDFPLSRAYAGKLLDLDRIQLGARSAVRLHAAILRPLATESNVSPVSRQASSPVRCFMLFMAPSKPTAGRGDVSVEWNRMKSFVRARHDDNRNGLAL